MNCNTCYEYLPFVPEPCGICQRHTIEVLDDHTCPDWKGEE